MAGRHFPLDPDRTHDARQRLMPRVERLDMRDASRLMYDDRPEAFGAYRAIVSDCPEAVRAAAWTEVAELLETFETPTGFVAPAEVAVAATAQR